MGIKGIYKEIGAGARVSFLRLAVDSLEKRGRPMRLAIDISIWQFQAQAARGGSNPAIRTLFYRLVRLLGMPVQPVFVFDGLNKPLFKRNKRSTGPGDGMASAMAKRMIRMFGFYVHEAPGEAEAECALLQQRGVVDAVLSEDVDTLMFGCTRTLRNWSAATTTSSGKGSASATLTHVSMYETEAAIATSINPENVLRTKESGLDREGLVLVALMSGGDYLPEGVPGCGVKLACEAAKAGYGRSLCRIKRADTAALMQWRSNLQHELRTNESKFFRTCHRKLIIPEDFPNVDILRYYTHPAVSPADVVERVRTDLDAALKAIPPSVMALGAGSILPKPIDILGLRDFVAETFDWANRGGAIKFIRVLAPSLLTRMLLLKWSSDGGKEDTEEDLDNDTSGADKELLPSLVEGVSRQRTHASTDNTPELRVSYIPVTVVGLDLERELDDPETSFGRDGLALNSDDEFDEPPPTAAPPSASGYTAATLTVASARKLATAIPYDPTVAAVTWIPRTIVEIGAPGALGDWDQKQQRGKKGASTQSAEGTKTTRKAKSPSKAAKSGMQPGALDRFVRVTKNTSDATTVASKTKTTAVDTIDPLVTLPATFKPIPSFQDDLDSNDEDGYEVGRLQIPDDYDLPAISRERMSRPAPSTSGKNTKTPPRKKAGNPWTLAGTQDAPRVTKSSVSSAGDQKREYVRPTTPKGTTATTKRQTTQSHASSSHCAPNVISLLSSSPVPAASSATADVPVSSNTISLPSASFSSAAWSPLPSSVKMTSPSRNTATAAIGKTTKPVPKPRFKMPDQTTSPQKQASILSFLSSQTVAAPSSPTKAPVTILLSDDKESDVASGRRVRVANEDDVFLSSSPPQPRKKSSRVQGVEVPAAEVVSTKTTPAKKVGANTKRTRYVPRTSAAGYFREEVVDTETIETTGSPTTHGRRHWRHSEIGVIDLTQEGL
ncbi:hypothetical protein SEUCBS139899_004997 [Sporothrix eucalyptigena]|uniref:Flap structure-specific endonuclease n=1 Tax=Sporothrix eucalyptigena TaxID=1812306 RepID=A0ABP0AWY3_9PEZI